MAEVVAVARQKRHLVTKDVVGSIVLIEGRGVEGDAHLGEKVQHRYDARKHPDRVNLRQVHLIQSELFEELAGKGFDIAPGQMGENVTTRAVDLLSLPTGTRLRLGDEAIVELTGLRSPCVLLDRISPGLMKAVLDRDADGGLIRKSGVMAIVIAGGAVSAEDQIIIELPDGPLLPLEPV